MEVIPQPDDSRCDCQLCSYHRYVTSVIALRDVDKLIALVTELHDENADTLHDLSYHQCILDGSWPSSVSILERALKRAKEHPNRKEDGRVSEST